MDGVSLSSWVWQVSVDSGQVRLEA